MLNFYGGPKGENYVVSHIFENTQQLRKDIDLGGASPIALDEIVMISYGLPGTSQYDTNFKLDYGGSVIDKLFFTHNPYLEYYPSTEHHFETNGHKNLYTILDERYFTGNKYNGIKNLMSESTNCNSTCVEANKSKHKVWVKFNFIGDINFNGNFVLPANKNEQENYRENQSFEWHLATSIQEAITNETNTLIASFGQSDSFENTTTVPIELNEYENDKVITNDNGSYTITNSEETNEKGQQQYFILAVNPKSIINFTTLQIVRDANQPMYLNFNSCLYQKTMKDQLNETKGSMLHIISDNSKFAYKFLTSSLGSTPEINVNTEFIDSGLEPEVSKDIVNSSLRNQIFNVKLPYPSTITEGINEETELIEYLQLKYKEEGKEIEYNIYIPTISATTKTENGGSFTITTTDTGGKTDEATLNLPTLSVAGENGAVIVTVKDNNNNSEQQTEITVVPEFDVNKEGNISWRLKGTDDEYTGLGNILGPQGEQGEQGEALQVTQQFSTTIGHNSNEPIAIESIISGGFIRAINEGLINLDIIEINEVIMGGINCKFYSYEYDESGEVVSTNFENEESYVAFYTLATKDSQSSFTYQDKEIQFSYIPVSNIENSQVKYISSTDNQSLILNTSNNYDPTDKIFGAEGLTAGETNKIGTKVFDIVGYEGTEGGEGYYVLNCESEQIAADMLTDISAAIEEQKNKSKALKWSIKAGFCYDYAGNIISAEEMTNNSILEISQEFQDFSFDQILPVDLTFYAPIDQTNYAELLNSENWGVITFNNDAQELSEKITNITIELEETDTYKYVWTTANYEIKYAIGNITISKINENTNFNSLTKISIKMNLKETDENTKKLIKLTVDSFYSNATLKGEKTEYSSKQFNKNDRPGYYNCAPLGYYIENQVNEGNTEATEGILYICEYPEIGIRELFGRSYSFGVNNISQQAFSFQSGYGNQGYNKYGITVGQENISGYGNAVFGRWNDIGFAQMNISQGDYNKIGNYAKYDAQFGLKLKSNYDHQYQFGRYNKNKENNIIEVGYGSNEINRKNVFEVDKEGKIYSNEMENMVDQKITIFANTSKIQLVNIEPVWKKYPNYIMSEYLYDGGYDHYMTISSDCFEKNQRYLVEFCFQLKVEESGTLNFRELITGTGTRVEAFRNKYQTLNLEASDSLYTCIVTRFINPDEKDGEITNIESYGIGIHVSSTAKVIFHHTNTKIRQVYYIDDLFNNYTKNLFINLKNINTIITGEQDIFSFENDKEYISYNDILYLIPKEAIENYEIINTYVPSEFTQYNSQKWKTKLKLSYANFEESDGHYKVIDCLGLSADQDVMISFNPEYGIDLETYTQQKEIYDLIISNSYAETDNDKVIIHIVNPNIIDVENTTECPILIKVV